MQCDTKPAVVVERTGRPALETTGAVDMPLSRGTEAADFQRMWRQEEGAKCLTAAAVNWLW